MKTGRIEYAPDYQSRSVTRRLTAQGVGRCEWCGCVVKMADRRDIEVRGKTFKVCTKCPPPDNANAMRT